MHSVKKKNTRTVTQNNSALTHCYIIQDQSPLITWALVAVFSLYGLTQLSLLQKPIEFNYIDTLCSMVILGTCQMLAFVTKPGQSSSFNLS